MQSQNGKRLVFPEIPQKFSGKFPAGHVNDVKGWNFSRQELLEAARGGRMLTMDWDMYGKFSCSARCTHCFEADVLSRMKKGSKFPSDMEVKQVILDAKALGLRSVKIIGPGEPLENRSLLDCLDFLKGEGINALIFTKGTSLGDDSLAQRTFGIDSETLIRKLKEEYGISINFGANSFHPETQAQIVRMEGYPAIRNLAMERLAAAGFNEFIPGQPTRFAFIFNPITLQNIDEVFEVYTWARSRNIYVISSPTMVSGPCRAEEAYRAMTPPESELLDLYVKINLWNIEHGISTLEGIERDGISSYVGVLPCQQLGAGLFIRRDGLALRCPGDDISIQGRIGEKSLAEIWLGSENYARYRGKINVGCLPKAGKSIPEGFFEKVLEEVRRRIESMNPRNL